MARSVFDGRTLDQVYKEIRDVYLSDGRPWILGFSGGKDSTCMVQLVWTALAGLPREKLQKTIHVISSDTLVESPQIAERITGSLLGMEGAAKRSGIPLSTNLLRPPISDTFWVRILGRGYPAPTAQFRWCTDMLKIANADRFIRRRVSQYGEVIVLLGTRKDESSTRQQTMNMLEIENSVLSHHKKFAQTYVYTPLVDFTADDVWDYLLQTRNPWGENNRDLLALYKDANAGECPLVVDTSTPACGGGRFGCWTCTVVDKQKSLDSMMENGNDWMETLVELRHDLKATQDPEMWPRIRSMTRRSGNVDIKRDGTDYTPGPYTLEFRKEYLEKLLRGQNRIRMEGPDPNMTLILEDEVHEIQRCWRTEEGDWQDSAYAIYERITGTRLEEAPDDLGRMGRDEQELLEAVCGEYKVPYKLVSTLINIEADARHGAGHASVFPSIRKELSKEWRTDVDAIRRDMFEQRDREAEAE